MTGYSCFACSATYGADFSGYTCTHCGGNLDVTYDYDSLRERLATHQLLDPRRDDIFRYVNLLPIENPAHAPPLRVGATPLYKATRLGQALGLTELYLKDDGLNPSGSFKDRASAVALARAVEQGARVVAGASTGNAGSSMACMAASMGVPCVIFVPEKAPPAKIAQLLIFGAQVLAVRGTYDEAFDLCASVCEERGWFNRNTGYNPFTREGKKTASIELCEQMSWLAPDRILVAVGDGNIISGIWKGLRDLLALDLIAQAPKVDCAQSAQSAAVTRTVERARATRREGAVDWAQVEVQSVQATTLADSISVDFPRDGLAGARAVVESGGEAVAVDDAAIMEALSELPRLSGVFAEPSAATTYACLKQMVADGRIQPDERVVCLLTGNGLKDVGRARQAAGEPTVIDPSPEAARRAVEQWRLT